MPKRKLYARIAITLPDADLAAADRLARAQDRSRSWIVAGRSALRAAMDLTGPPRRHRNTLATASPSTGSAHGGWRSSSAIWH
jgi:hypothetical protein